MPVPKIAFKSTVLDLEVENVEFTVGSEIMKVGHLKASLDVADLLRVQLPSLIRGDSMGVMLLDHGERKIQCIKTIRAMTDWGLKEAKIFVESPPILLKAADMIRLENEDMNRRVEIAAAALEEAGSTIEIVYGKERPPTVLDRFREMLVEALRGETKVSSPTSDEV